jgi:hypothetical protein
MKRCFLLLLMTGFYSTGWLMAQTADEIIRKVKAKVEKVNDYEASGTLKTNVSFIKTPVADVKIYFKKPQKVKIKNESGISLVPKGAININISNVFEKIGEYDILDAGKEGGTGLRIIKLLPKKEESDIVLATLYIEESSLVIRKAKITSKENGTHELELSYGKYTDYGLPDKLIFTFNVKDYKLPKGIVLDYDDGIDKKKTPGQKDEKGKVEITYSEYKINKGVSDSVFQ